MAYTDSTLIGNYLQRALTAYETDFLAVLIPAIQTWLDSKLGTTFDVVSETSKTYDGGEPIIDIEPVQSVSAVKALDSDGVVNHTYVNITDYILEPQNETIKNELRKRNGCWPVGLKRIQVTGLFTSAVGNANVPEDIKVVATRVAGAVINLGKADSDGANVKKESLDEHSIEYDTSSEAIAAIAQEDNVTKGILEQRRQLLL